MKQKLQKILIGCVALLLVICASSFIDTRTAIKFASWGSKTEVDIIKPIIEEFEKENPTIRVEFMHIPQNYFQKIHLLFASKTPPDVLFINNLYLPIYADAGVLEPIGEWAEWDAYDDNTIRALSWKGKLYAVPRDVSNLVVFYNKDLFDKAGLEYPTEDWTLEEFLLVAQILTKNGVFGVSFEEEPLFFLPYLMSEGGGIVSDDLSNIIRENEKSKKGLEFYSNLRKKYHVAPLADESASATMAQLFLQEKIAMHITGRWLVPKYRAEAKFKWDIISFPKGDAGSVVPLDASGWAVADKSKHKEEAYTFINFISNKKNIEKLTESGLIVPARRDVQTSKYFLDGKSPQNAQIFINIINTSKPTPVSINYREILDNLSPKFEKMFR